VKEAIHTVLNETLVGKTYEHDKVSTLKYQKSFLKISPCFSSRFQNGVKIFQT